MGPWSLAWPTEGPTEVPGLATCRVTGWPSWLRGWDWFSPQRMTNTGDAFLDSSSLVG